MFSEDKVVVHVLHPWALSIMKHKTKIIMNLTYVDHKVKGDDSYAFSIRVSELICL